MVTVWAWAMRTTWLAVGMIPPAQVAELDQLPLPADWMVGCTLSDEKSGMISGCTVGGGVTGGGVTGGGVTGGGVTETGAAARVFHPPLPPPQADMRIAAAMAGMIHDRFRTLFIADPV
jgi:hypothetical protein